MCASTARRPQVAARKLRAGQRLQLELVPTEESRAFRPQPMALDIVFEDEHLLVLDKPAGLVVHPAPGNWSGTLLNGLLAHHAGGGHAAARRHRAPARQGHLRPDGGGQDAAGGDRAVARHRRARGAPPLPGAGPRPRGLATSRRSTRRSAATRCRASAWRCWRRASRRAPTCSASAAADGLQRAGVHAAHRPHPPDPRAPGLAAATRWWPTRCTAARPRWACSARRCMPRGLRLQHPIGGRLAGLRLRRRRPTLPRPGRRSRNG